MNESSREDRPVIGRYALNHRGERIRLSPSADAAHFDAYGNPDNAASFDDDGNPVVRGPYGEAIPLNITDDPDAEPPPHDAADADGDDSGLANPAHEHADTDNNETSNRDNGGNKHDGDGDCDRREP